MSFVPHEYRPIEIDVYSKDLRYKWHDLQSGRYDLVSCLEVIEHIADLTPSELGEAVAGYIVVVASVIDPL